MNYSIQPKWFPRLMSHVEGKSDGCWLWSASKTKGYGRFRSKRAHRLVYEIMVGPIPSGLFVLHKCDVRNCVNPEHLYLGTHLDNMRDYRMRYKAKRSSDPRFGPRNGNAKLTIEEVMEIQELQDKMLPHIIAERYEVSRTCIRNIFSGKSWKDISP